MVTSQTPILEFRGLTKRFPLPDKTELTVLDNIQRTVHEGELVTLVGPSGCGKSTLFNLILGSIKPSSGSVLLDGEPVTGSGPDRGIVYQGYNLYPHLSVVQNVMLGGTLSRSMFENSKVGQLISRTSRAAVKEDYDRALEYLDRVSLRAAADKYPHELSGGMQQRVAIVQALFTRPRILLMDEPFGALDTSTRHDAQLFLIELWEKFGLTVIFVTHSLEEAVFMGTRVLALSQHYEHPDGAHHTDNGSRFVIDADMSRHVKRRHAENMSPDFYVSKFTKLLDQINHEAMDKRHRQHISQFRTGDPEAFGEVIKWEEAQLTED